jgi:hypothetical protein
MLAKIDETAGVQWLQAHLDYCVRPLLAEPWVLDVDATIKPLYGHQEGAVVGYNSRKPGRPSHCYHTFMLSDQRLVLRVAVIRDYAAADGRSGAARKTATARRIAPGAMKWQAAQEIDLRWLIGKEQ